MRFAPNHADTLRKVRQFRELKLCSLPEDGFEFRSSGRPARREDRVKWAVGKADPKGGEGGRGRQLRGVFREAFEGHQRGLAVVLAFEDANKATGRGFLDLQNPYAYSFVDQKHLLSRN